MNVEDPIAAVNKDNLLTIAIFSFLYVVLFALTAQNPFFWDTVQLGSMHAHHIYESNFSSLNLPDYMDSGHPPLLGFLLAISWKLLGKSLLVSHLLILPFLLLLIVQVVHFVNKFVKNKTDRFFLASLVLFDPTLLSQATLVSPDIILISFFFFSLNQLIGKNRLLAVLGLVVLALISMRGMMICFALFLFIVFHDYFLAPDKRDWFQILISRFLIFLPAGTAALSFLVFHYLSKGWVGYHDASPWFQSFQIVKLKVVVRNFFISIWRVIDFGRIFLYGLLLCILLLKRKSLAAFLKSKPFIFLISLSVILFVFTVLPLIFYKGLLAHRYLLPFILVLSIIAGVAICFFTYKSRFGQIIKVSALIGLLTGNLWTYPEGIAMGWDSTLAHLPYYSLKKEMINYLNNQAIPIEKVGVAFPEEARRKFIDLSSDTSSFHRYNLETSEYILYSNVYNAFRDMEIFELKEKWVSIKNLTSPTVTMILYKKPD